jgi:AraC family transcriptional regulator
VNEHTSYITGELNDKHFPSRFSNVIYFSDHAKFFLRYKSIYSIKFPVTGVDNFRLNHKMIQLEANNYLIVNNDQEVDCLLGNSEKAISIFIEPELLTDVFNACKRNNEDLLSNPFDIQNNKPMFFENSYPFADNPLTELLLKLSYSFDIQKKNANKFDIGFFFKVSEALILSQQETFKEIRRIDAVKKSTKIELYNRMIIARDYIYDNWDKNISLEVLAKSVCMSPYHFHRTFTSVFGHTASQYHKIIKMKKAKELISLKTHSISEVAEIIGYDNIHSFSKSFKKLFGSSPSHLLNN